MNIRTIVKNTIYFVFSLYVEKSSYCKNNYYKNEARQHWFKFDDHEFLDIPTIFVKISAA